LSLTGPLSRFSPPDVPETVERYIQKYSESSCEQGQWCRVPVVHRWAKDVSKPTSYPEVP
jgi:hypothetical protein